MIKRNILLGALLATCFCSLARAADDTNAAAAGTNAMAAMPGMATNAAPADTGPKPDPAGTATGMAVDASSPSGNFIVTAPADLSDDDKKDPTKVKKYADDKKAFDDYTAAAKVESLALKLADVAIIARDIGKFQRQR